MSSNLDLTSGQGCGKPVVIFRDFTFRYRDADEDALRDIDLCFERGGFYLVAGATGSGKTTLLRSMIGLIPHVYEGEYSGEVVVLGKDVRGTQISELARHVGYVFQNPENQIFMFSVERDVAFTLENMGLPPAEIKRRVEWALETTGIKDLRDKAPYELSDGQKQRVAVAGALASEPEILILDEPTSLLDPLTATTVLDFVEGLSKMLNLTVIAVEHRLELLLPKVDFIIALKDGRVVLSGRPRRLFENEVNINRLKAAGIAVPPVVDIYHEVAKRGIKMEKPPMTVDELVSIIKRISPVDR